MPQCANSLACRHHVVQQTVENSNDTNTTCNYAACSDRTSALRICGSPICRADNDKGAHLECEHSFGATWVSCCLIIHILVYIDCCLSVSYNTIYYGCTLHESHVLHLSCESLIIPLQEVIFFTVQHRSRNDLNLTFMFALFVIGFVSSQLYFPVARIAHDQPLD